MTDLTVTQTAADFHFTAARDLTEEVSRLLSAAEPPTVGDLQVLVSLAGVHAQLATALVATHYMHALDSMQGTGAGEPRD